ncbi:MAG: hypothetical protein A2Z29_04030 [Chloroflexi bacterium RBG_16_56_11]|nr:MAG: hypothetical protein A2Z29_04030 [Chloroflexi bacterium RBG_16_56_11]
MKVKSKAISAVLLVTCIWLVSVTGCSGKDGTTGGDDVTAENISSRIQSALSQLNSYEMGMTMTLEMNGMVDGESGDISVSTVVKGAIDTAEKQLYLDLNGSVKGEAGTETIDEVTSISTYIIGDDTYIGYTEGAGEMSWQYQTTSSGTWDQQQQISQLMGVLDTSVIKTFKSEKIEGTNCYLIELDPEPGVVWSLVQSQMGPSAGGSDFNNIGNAIKEMTVKYWLVEDSLFFKKANIKMVLDLGAEQMDATEGQVHLVAEVTMDFDEHNKGTDIKLPEAAKASKQ